MKPLVSVITATHKRHQALLERCIPSVKKQTYSNIEHIVVSDGPDDLLREKLAKRYPKVRYFETGRNWHELSGLSWGCEPRTLGMFAAKGDYICVVDDDDTVTPDHVSSLVEALEGTEHWFALAQYEHSDGRLTGDGSIAPNVVGTCSILFRPECLCASVMRPGSYLGDYEWIARMAQANMTWTFTGRPTYLVSHALEELGQEVDKAAVTA